MSHPRPTFSRPLAIGLAALLVCLLAGLGIRMLWPTSSNTDGTPAPSAAELAAVRSFEAERRADSLQRALHQAQQREQWAQEKAQRDRARADRQAQYDAQRQQWAQEKADRQAARDRRQAHYDSLRALRPEKFAAGTVIDANLADTLALQRIPGIGSGYARAIVGYRERLGGFVDARQLAEIEGLPHGIEQWFRVASPTVQRLRLNHDTFRQLLRHPYLNFEQVKAIVNRRQKFGALRSLDELAASPQFAPADFARLAPYVQF